jgi:hypothetical protein
MSPNENQQAESTVNPTDEAQTLPAYQVEAIQRLQSKLSDNAAFFSEIELLIREHSYPVVSATTYGKILSGVELYLDEDTAYFLLHFIRFSNDASYLEQVKTQCTEPFWSVLRRLIALFGDDLRKAYTLFNENPNAWDVLNRHTYFDHLTNNWIMSLEIIKYNGERLSLEETPGGALTLIRGIMDMLMNVPAENAPELIDKEYLADTSQLFYSFINHYAPHLLAGEDQEA